jgi:hypothetical protein
MQSYVLHTHFEIELPMDGSSVKDEKLHGVLSAVGRFELPTVTTPQSQLIVYFDKLVLRPADPGSQLQSWLDTLLPHNEGMRRDDGVLEIVLSTSPRGALDYILMTEKWQVHIGNFGSCLVMQRK